MRKDFNWRQLLSYKISDKIYPKVKDPFDEKFDLDKKLTKYELNFFNKQDLRIRVQNVLYITQFIITRLFYIGIGIVITYFYLRS